MRPVADVMNASQRQSDAALPSRLSELLILCARIGFNP